MSITSHWPAPREGISLLSDPLPAIGTAIWFDFGGLFHLSFFAILDMPMWKTALHLDTS